MEALGRDLTPKEKIQFSNKTEGAVHNFGDFLGQALLGFLENLSGGES